VKWLARAIILAVVVGEIWLFRDAFVPASTERPAAARRVDAPVADESILPFAPATEYAPDEVARVRQVVTAAAPASRTAQRTATPARPLESDAEREARIDDELERTERALAASRRRDTSSTVRAADARPAPSPEARAAAIAGASASLLECRDAGAVCRSSADCCPGLGCAGGVAGFGTPGRCEGPR
jgi:imidazolonepropionase-like amidohydrolase